MFFSDSVSQIEFSCVYEENEPKKRLGIPSMLYGDVPEEVYRRRGRILFDHETRTFLSHKSDVVLLELVSKELGL